MRGKKLASKRAVAALTIVLACICAGSLAEFGMMRQADHRLQQQADTATLQGVGELAAATALPDGQRIEASVRAVKAALAAEGLQPLQVEASLETMSVEVTASQPDGKTVVSAAYYVRPGQSLSPIRSSSLAKADRSRL